MTPREEQKVGLENKALVVKSEAEDIQDILNEYAEGMTEEDRAIHQAYEELARGEKVIDVTQAITTRKMGTTWRTRLPAMAVAPATVTEVDLKVGFRRDRDIEYAKFWALVPPRDVAAPAPDKKRGMFAQIAQGMQPPVPRFAEWRLDLPAREVYDFSNWRDQSSVREAHSVYRTQVPHVPIRIRKEFDITDPDRIILFEVGDWAEVQSNVKMYPPPPAPDPALLKRVTGNLYKVEATWEFTDLELQVIAGIRSAQRK